MLRFRPIMMTTMAAICGALPLAFGTGTGSELRRPLGITIVGGLLLSQLLTLYTTPVVYLTMDRCACARWAGRTTRCPPARGSELRRRHQRRSNYDCKLKNRSTSQLDSRMLALGWLLRWPAAASARRIMRPRRPRSPRPTTRNRPSTSRTRPAGRWPARRTP